jgi:Cu(I)/Ag(I) efflux system membrane fusion protein
MRLKKIFPALLLLFAGALLGQALLWAVPLPGSRTPAPFAGESGGPGADAPGKTKGAALYWYDPMYPGTRFDKPGKSPFMDMDLVPKYAGSDDGAGIRIDPVQVQNLGVRTERAQRGRLTFSRDIPANVEFNDYQLARVQPRAEGFVERTFSLAVGDTVRAGDPLADITVPGWASDQSEYLLLISQKADPRIIRGVRERMRLTGMPEEMLKAVDSTGRVQTRMTILAPIDGVLTGLEVYPGMNVDKAMTIAVIQGTNPVWVTADIPEGDVHLVREGARIRVSVPAWPDRAFHTTSFTLLPRADLATRTVPLRLVLDNGEGLLKPGMSAAIRLRGTGEDALLISTQSLIDLGGEQRVITRAPDGGFVPKKVHVLRSSGEKTALASGLEAGEEVVVSGLFLIDSEANLRGALERMRRDAADPAAGEQGSPAPAGEGKP